MNAPHPRISCEGAERILSAAGELFAEHGFDAVSMNAIAERAEVSKANIFHHFASKDALYLETLRHACQATRQHIEQLGDSKGSFTDRLHSFAREHLSHILANEKITRLIQRDLLEKGPQRGREFAEQVFGQNFARLVAIIREGQARGELRENVDPAMVAVMIIGTNIFFFQSREVFRHFPDVSFGDDPVAYSRMAVDMVLNGTGNKS